MAEFLNPFALGLQNMARIQFAHRSELLTKKTETTEHALEIHDGLNHIRIRDRCGLCEYLFEDNDKIVALTGPGLGGEYRAMDAALFRFSRDCYHNWTFCRDPACEQQGQSSEESATFHGDCYNLYMQRAKSRDAKKKLWTFVCWKDSPWLKCPPLKLWPKKAVLGGARLTGLPDMSGMSKLPTELLSHIWAEVGPSALGRYSLVLHTVEFLDRARDDRGLMPISHVQSWNRGGNLVENDDRRLIDRLITIDEKGLRSIENLDADEPGTFRSNGATLYAIARAGQSIRVAFTLGMARLVLDQDTHLQLSDVPISMTELAPVPGDGLAARLGTVDFATCTGVTFFIAKGAIYALHAHTSVLPYATSTFYRLPELLQMEVMWIYVPISPTDEVLGFGIVNGVFEDMSRSTAQSCFLRMAIAGDVVAGPFIKNPEPAFVYPVSKKSRLVYTISPGEPCRILGVHSPAGLPSLVKPLAPMDASRDKYWCHSSAVLTDVSCIRIYRESRSDLSRHPGLLRGLLIEYKNGGQRTLGECPIGFLPSETCHSVECLGFMSGLHLIDLAEITTDITTVEVLPLGHYASVYPGLGRESWTRCSEGSTIEVSVTRDGSFVIFRSPEGKLTHPLPASRRRGGRMYSHAEESLEYALPSLHVRSRYF